MTGNDFGRLYSSFDSMVHLPIMDMFDNVPEVYEPIKWLIIALVVSITKNAQAVFVMIAVIAMIPIYRMTKKRSLNYQYSIMLYFLIGFYTNSFNIAWQMAAASVVFMGVPFLLEKKYIKFFIISFVAAGLHISVLMTLPIFFLLAKIKPSLLNITIILASATLIATNSSFINQIISISIYEKYIDYRATNIGLYLQILVWFCFCLVFIIFKNRLIRIDPNNAFYIMCLTTAIALMIVATQNVIFDRVAAYFKMYILYLIPAFFELFGSYLKIIVFAIVTVIWFIWFSFYLDYSGVVPYQNIFFE